VGMISEKFGYVIFLLEFCRKIILIGIFNFLHVVDWRIFQFYYFHIRVFNMYNI
jgi:hypothetical protein